MRDLKDLRTDFLGTGTPEEILDRYIIGEYEKAEDGKYTYIGSHFLMDLEILHSGKIRIGAEYKITDAWGVVAYVCHKGSDTKMADWWNGEMDRREGKEEKAPEPEVKTPEPEYLTDSKGNLRSCVTNFSLYMKDHGVAKSIAFNDLTGQIDVLEDLPWRKGAAGTGWTDGDLANLRIWLEAQFGKAPKADAVDAVTSVAQANSYHPIRRMLESLPKWDGTERLDTLLIRYLGAADTPYTRTVTRIAFTAAVARVMSPGIKYDSMLITYGAQGIGKSSLFGIMGGDWFCDSLTSFGDKSAMEQLATAWLIEIPELAALSKRDANDVKAFLSKTSDSYRAAYGRYVETHPRQCVFFGSTNDRICLKDFTGNRRFLMVDCDAKRQVQKPNEDLPGERDQVWAEAMVRFKEGTKLYLEGEMLAQAERIQEDHRDEHPYESAIRNYLERYFPDSYASWTTEERHGWLYGAPAKTLPLYRQVEKRQRICAREIWCDALGLEWAAAKQSETRIINQLLDRLPEYRYVGPQRCGVYGVQRAYERIAQQDYQRRSNIGDECCKTEDLYRKAEGTHYFGESPLMRDGKPEGLEEEEHAEMINN